MFTSVAKIQYKSLTWVVADVPEDIVKYYRNWVKIKYGLKLYGSRWNSHITIVRGSDEDPLNNEFWMKYQDEEWEFKYSNKIHRDGNSVFWWLDVDCPKMLDMREELGLPRHPEHNLHVTIGREHPHNKISNLTWIS